MTEEQARYLKYAIEDLNRISSAIYNFEITESEASMQIDMVSDMLEEVENNDCKN